MSGHGHVTPNEFGMVARCGGPGLCAACSAELAATVPTPRCVVCKDTGHVCEHHPGRAWGALCCDVGADGPGVCEHGACGCGGAGMPCAACCSEIPMDGRHSILEAFTPDWRRPVLPAVFSPDPQPARRLP